LATLATSRERSAPHRHRVAETLVVAVIAAYVSIVRPRARALRRQSRDRWTHLQRGLAGAAQRPPRHGIVAVGCLGQRAATWPSRPGEERLPAHQQQEGPRHLLRRPRGGEEADAGRAGCTVAHHLRAHPRFRGGREGSRAAPGRQARCMWPPPAGHRTARTPRARVPVACGDLERVRAPAHCRGGRTIDGGAVAEPPEGRRAPALHGPAARRAQLSSPPAATDDRSDGRAIARTP